MLWSHVLEALRRVCPGVGLSAPPEVVGATGIVDVVLPQLVNELSEQGEVALILDDFHRLSSGPAANSIAWLVEHAPSTFTLVLGTRSEPALPLGALRAHGALREVRADELGFTSDEAEALLNGRLQLGLAREDIDDLVARSEGWPPASTWRRSRFGESRTATSSSAGSEAAAATSWISSSTKC